MFDFQMTKKGDLELDYDESWNVPQKISFVVSDYEAQRIKFLVKPLVPPERKPAQQRISFRFANLPEPRFALKTLQDTDELAQAIRIALRTETNDVYDGSVGTKLYQLRHKTIRSKEDLQAVADKIKVIVNDILPGADTALVDEEYSDAGYFRFESYTIEIWYGGKKIADYILL